jgi:arylsulfatase A-like enzyme
VLLLLASLAGGCGGEPQGFLLLPLVQTKSYAVGHTPENADGLSFGRAPELRAVEIGHERRPAVITPPGSWRWRGRVPQGARLHVGVQALPEAWKKARGLAVPAVVHQGQEREILEVAYALARPDPSWLDFDADLGHYAGQEVTLELAAHLDGLPADRRTANLVAWSPVVISNDTREATPEKARRPNVLFILIDTLRHDHTTPYGYQRDTTPEIARLLAAHGTVVEDTYSQAPWTLPSVVSFMTGRYPGELLGQDLSAYAIPKGIPSLPERFAELGYETAGFIANPSLHAGAGFDRGFRTLYVPPADIRWMLDKHADDVNAHVLPWLAAYQDQERPFFLYVHYIDPHDPYMNPDLVGGYRSPFMPDYKGPIAGDWIHGIYGGKLQLTDPAADVAHIRALYDNEVHYVDRYVGQIVSALKPEVLANTLIVLTADHGEELYDHGGWKHGQTLYEEQIHVPLIFRWDGRIPAGRRLAGTTALLDLVPTLMAAAGAKPEPEWDGIDLLPALTRGKPLPRRAIFAQNLSGGPLRAAAVMDRHKLVLFNSREPFAPADDLQRYLWQKDLGRLKRVELYDLARDEAERSNLAETEAKGPAEVEQLSPVIHGQLGHELPGLWVIASAGGGRLGGSILFERPPAGWMPYFLAPGDHVELAGNRLRFDLAADRIDKGFRVEGDFGAVLAVEAAGDGGPLPAGALRVGKGQPYNGSSLRRDALRATGWLTADRRGALWLGIPDTGPRRREASNPETEKRLKALGYIQ